MKFDGFLKVYFEGKDEDEEEDNEGILPPLAVKQNLELKEMTATEKFSRAGARFTEASLVKKLEGHTNHFLQLPFEEKTKNMKKFQTHCIQEVKHADTELRYNNNWKPFFKNLILAFTGIGILASITSFTARAITGRYAFFDTPTQTKLPQLKILFKELKSEEPETPPINKTR